MHMSTATFLDFRKLNMLGLLELPINLICKIAPLFLIHIKSICVYIYKQQYRWVRVLINYKSESLEFESSWCFYKFYTTKNFFKHIFFGQIL